MGRAAATAVSALCLMIGTTPAARASSGSIAERVSDRMNRARPADADFDDLASPDSAEDNVEIPAFLRRQAN